MHLKKTKSTENFKLSRHVILNTEYTTRLLATKLLKQFFFREIDDKPMVIISVHLFKFAYLERVYYYINEHRV